METIGPISTPVGRRIGNAIVHHKNGDFESALLQLFPAVNRTATRRFPKKGDGYKIKTFISQEEAVITFLATGSIWIGSSFDGMTLPELIYKYGRNAMVHDGEMDHRLKFHRSHTSIFGFTSVLSDSFIFGLLMSVILAEENRLEISPDNHALQLLGRSYYINTLWGARSFFVELVRDKYGDSSLFL
ncbi:MAG: hypothetical protein Q8K20_05285 [Gemmobacter sp.]|nr:hypothetical protein [Gemmobacter sp.]